MNINYMQLIEELKKPQYQNQTIANLLVMVNEPSITYYVPVSSVDVTTYLMETESQVLAPMSLYNVLSATYRNTDFPQLVQVTAENIIDLANGVNRDLNLRGRENPDVPNQYEKGFMVLIQAGRYLQNEVDAILNLGERQRSVVASMFGDGVVAIESDITRALYPENYDAWQEVQARIGRAYNQVVVQSQNPDLSTSPPSWDEVIEQMRSVE